MVLLAQKRAHWLSPASCFSRPVQYPAAAPSQSAYIFQPYYSYSLTLAGQDVSVLTSFVKWNKALT